MTPTPSAAAELALYDARVTEAEKRDINGAAKAAEELAPLRDLNERERRAALDGDDRARLKLVDERIRLEALKKSWQNTTEGFRQGITLAKAERAAYITTHGDNLVAEHRGEAEQVVEQLVENAKATLASIDAFYAVKRKVDGFVDYSRHRHDDPRIASARQHLDALLDENYTPPSAISPLKLTPLPLDPPKELRVKTGGMAGVPVGGAAVIGGNAA